MGEQALDAHLEQWEQRPEEMIKVERGYLEWLEGRVEQLKADLGLCDKRCQLLQGTRNMVEAENERLRGALIILRPKMLEAQEVMREHGFVIDNLKDPWQKFAFTLYSMLVQVHCVSDTALGGE